jgi:hypothetical protein
MRIMRDRREEKGNQRRRVRSRKGGEGEIREGQDTGGRKREAPARRAKRARASKRQKLERWQGARVSSTSFCAHVAAAYA